MRLHPRLAHVTGIVWRDQMAGDRPVPDELPAARRLVQLPLPTLDGLAYPRAADGLVHQCAWCGRVVDRAGRFRIPARVLRGEVSHGLCSNCAVHLRPAKVPPA